MRPYGVGVYSARIFLSICDNLEVKINMAKIKSLAQQIAELDEDKTPKGWSTIIYDLKFNTNISCRI